jgi:hypothetical protein
MLFKREADVLSAFTVPLCICGEAFTYHLFLAGVVG